MAGATTEAISNALNKLYEPTGVQKLSYWYERFNLVQSVTKLVQNWYKNTRSNKNYELYINRNWLQSGKWKIRIGAKLTVIKSVWTHVWFVKKIDMNQCMNQFWLGLAFRRVQYWFVFGVWYGMFKGKGIFLRRGKQIRSHSWLTCNLW